eukprot:COSAG06_NODE_6742_length_2801_cov_15.678621_3_plen_171_part_00
MVSWLMHGPGCLLADLSSLVPCAGVVMPINVCAYRHAYDAAAEGLRATHHIGGGAGEDPPTVPSPPLPSSARVDGSGADASVSKGGGGGGGVEERRQLTEFLRRPWIHDSAQQHGVDGLENVGVARTSTAGTADATRLCTTTHKRASSRRTHCDRQPVLLRYRVNQRRSQ